MSELQKKIEHAINSVSAENGSNTPDFILAQYLTACLSAFDTAVQQRETWYGRDARPTETLVPSDPDDARRRAQEAQNFITFGTRHPKLGA